MRSWVWLGRLSLFVGLFFLFSFAAFWVVARLGVPMGEGLSIGGVVSLVLGGLGASWFLTRRVEGRPLGTLGLREPPAGLADLGLGVGAGVGIIGLVVLAMVAMGWLSWQAAPEPGSAVGTAFSLAGLLFGAAFTEELLFRGYPFQLLQRHFGALAAIALTSLSFGLLHGANPNVGPLALVNITLAGVLLGVAYWRTGSLWFATGLHLGWNWVMAVSELSVSGIDMEMPAFDPTVLGPQIWTGGDFGPEGGLLVTAATLLALVGLWRLSPRDESLSAFESRHPPTHESSEPSS